MSPVIDAFVQKFVEELRADNAAIFVGAGLSKAAGFVDWTGLLAPIATPLGLDAAKEHDLVGLAQHHLNANNSQRGTINQLLVDEFSDLPAPTENHVLLGRLPVQTYWTTNYDRLLEEALRAGGKRVDVKYKNQHLATTKRGRDAVVMKMHGDIENPDEAILSRDDYERYHLTHAPFITALSGDLVEKTFLFLGFSFTDPNLDFILSRVRVQFSKDQRRHFCVMKQRTKGFAESDADFIYATTKQELFARDLLRFNIQVLFVDTFDQITKVLRSIESLFRRRTVFVSGSAADYAPWGREEIDTFMVRLSRELIQRDLRIASGFGLGVGGAVVSGAVSEIYSSSRRSIDEQLILRPFPIGIADRIVRDKTKTRYREELIAQAGIAIFVAGNKIEEGVTFPADGVQEEYRIARQYRVIPIPLGATGWAAAKIWTDVMADSEIIFGAIAAAVRPHLEAIGPGVAPADVMAPLLALIDLLT